MVEGPFAMVECHFAVIKRTFHLLVMGLASNGLLWFSFDSKVCV